MPDGMGGFTQFLPFVLILAAFYFLIIRPQQTREKKRRRMLEELTKGDIVVTRGGLQGRIDDAKDDLLKVNIAEGVRVEIRRSHVEFVVKAGELIEG